jgi:gliding motility-associated-like protein
VKLLCEMKEVCGTRRRWFVALVQFIMLGAFGLGCAFEVVAQNTGDCFSAIPVCQGVYTEANSPPGEGDLPDEISSALSCLGGGEVDGQWYTFTVQNSGQFCFSIVPNNIANDYDWAVFNLTNANCEDIATNGSLEVSCNFSGVSGVTGANGLGGAQNNPCIPVQTGQTYVLYVSNWSQSAFGYTLNTQVPGTSASIFDNTPPSLATSITVECPRTEIAFSFSEQVLCSSVQPSDITVSGPGAAYTITAVTSDVCSAGGDQANEFVATVSPALSGTGPFTINISGEVIDLCGNPSIVGTSVTFNLDQEMTLDVAMTPTGCGGPATGSLTATAVDGQAAFIYRLNGGSPQVNNGTYSNLAAGTYTLSVLDANGCIATAPGTVEVESDMESAVTSTNVICHGDADGEIVVSTTGLGGSWDYTWLDANMNVIRSTIGAVGDTLLTGPGNFAVVIAETTPGVVCTDTLEATISEPPLLEWITTPSDTTICQTGSATVQASTTGGTNPVQVIWSPVLTGIGPHVISPSSNANYSVRAVDGNGCTLAPVPFTLFVHDSIRTEPLAPFTICNGVPFTIDLSATSGGDGDLHFTWNNGADDGPVITDSLFMDATLCVTVSDGCETPLVNSCAEITVLHTPVLEISADTTFGCVPFEVQFMLLDTTGSASVLWNFGNGITATGSATISYIYPHSGLFDVTPTVTWPNGCVTDTTLFDLVRVIPVPRPDFTWSPNPLSIFEPDARFIELAGPNEVSYAWDFFEFGISGDPSPVVAFPNDIGRYYPVQLTVENELGCRDSILRQVHVEDQFLVYVPNAFSPNGDGINEVFGVVGNDISPEEFELLIFDRWGEQVFASKDQRIFWNGTDGGGGGEVLQQGVYNWRLNIRSLQTLQKRIVYGHVTLLR